LSQPVKLWRFQAQGLNVNIIETRELTKVFPGGVRAVDGVDFEVTKGEIFGFLGPNGAGKTTAIKMLNTLLQPTSGSATVAGFDIRKDPAAVRRNVGYVAQDVGVDEHATGRENLTLYGHFYRLDGRTIAQRVRELFELVDLIGYEDKMVSTYSGGMRKRLDIAMGLIHQPQLIFLDEPTVGLDPQTRVHIWDYIRSLARAMGVTIFLTTHYMEEADHLADRIAIIDLGKIMALGTPDDLKRTIGGDVVTLSPALTAEPARDDFMKRTQAALEGKPFVLGMQPTDGDLAVYVNKGESAAPSIMRLLASEGIEVASLSVSRPSLDDVFLKYTGRTIRAQEGTATTYAQMRRMRDRRHR
jgi:ABC-2 type transport system ATP-binding protein